MSESNNENFKKTSSAKKTFIGIVIFGIIYASITYACIYMTLENRKQKENETFENSLIDSEESENTEKYVPLKLTDKARINKITEEKVKEDYGDIIDYYEYSNETVKKLTVDYFQISGLKNKKVQEDINKKIQNKINGLKEELLINIDDDNIERMTLSADIMGNFSDVISIYIYEYIFYNYNDEDYENDTSESNIYTLNLALKTGEEISFQELFWEDSPIKTILSQSMYKELAWEYAFSNEDWDWDWNMEGEDYSLIESRLYNFLHDYNKNPNLDFYFTNYSIEIINNGNTDYQMYTIKMEDFYNYIAIYTRFKSEENLYEDSSEENEFYVFGDSYINDRIVKSGKLSKNTYCTIYSYDDLNEMEDEAKKALEFGGKALDEKINEYIRELEKNSEKKGYVVEAYYISSEYEGKYGYNLSIEIAECSREYFDENLVEALAKGARTIREEAAPINYEYVDSDNFEFYESYSEWVDDYKDETTKNSNYYTREQREIDLSSWENT